MFNLLLGVVAEIYFGEKISKVLILRLNKVR